MDERVKPPAETLWAVLAAPMLRLRMDTGYRLRAVGRPWGVLIEEAGIPKLCLSLDRRGRATATMIDEHSGKEKPWTGPPKKLPDHLYELVMNRKRLGWGKGNAKGSPAEQADVQDGPPTQRQPLKGTGARATGEQETRCISG